MIVSGERIAVRREDYALLTEKFLVNCRILVSGNTENDAVPRFDVFLQVVQGGSFLDARRAPGRPEIQYHDLAFEIGQMPWFPRDIHGKVSRGGAGNRGLALTIGRHRK